MDDLVEDCPTIPSGALKEQILVLLESNERSMKVLVNVLKIDTVRAFVSNYEECHGQVSLDTWKYILRQLEYSEEYFQQPGPADQMIPGATDIAGIPVDDLEENGHGAQSISRVWPKWSLLPPDESSLKENFKEDAANGDGDHDFPLQAAAENGPSHRNNIIPSTVQSLSQGNSNTWPTLGCVPVVENERSHHENSTLAEIEGREENLEASSVQADNKQQTTTPSRPTTPEAPRSTHDPVVTGQHRSHQNQAMAEPYPPGNGEESQESGNTSKTPTENDCRAENDCIENNNGLYAELQKANESLQLNVSYLVQELRKKDLVCARIQNECNSLQQQLLESSSRCTQLQIINEEFERRLEESAELENESQELIRMIQEVCNLREQENNRLEEHIRQLDQRHDNANHCMEDLRRECQELSEELRLAFNQMRALQERDHNLEREREQLRLHYEERMAEAARAFNNAETDKVKRLKQKLAREKSKRKSLDEKTRQLEAFVNELRLEEEGHFPSGGSREDDAGENSESSTTASSEAEDDEQFGSSNHNPQLSDSDGSNEDGRLEDASTDAIES